MRGRPTLEHDGRVMVSIDSRRRIALPFGERDSIYGASIDAETGTITLEPMHVELRPRKPQADS